MVLTIKKRYPAAPIVISVLALMIGCGSNTLNNSTGVVLDSERTQTTEKIAWPAAKSPLFATNTKREQGVNEQVSALLQSMSIEEKVGQILQAEIQTIRPEDVKKYHIGSILNGGDTKPNNKFEATAQDWLALADKFYLASMDTSDGGVAIPVIWGTDAVHGHNNLFGATIFPHNIGLGAANNEPLIREIGAATAREVRASGIPWVFAPTLAVAQNDLWGRTYESYSENPALVARYAKAMVEGLQGVVGESNFLDDFHVVATAKHYLADGGTEGGDDQGNARISEKELVDIHAAGYPVAINRGVQSVMVSFSAWNGEKMHGNHYLLTEKLRGDMGFDGLVVSDWNGHGQVPGCTNDSCAQAINAGIDLIMAPYDWKAMFHNTLAQVQSGEITEARLNQAVTRILRVKVRAGLFHQKPSDQAGAKTPDTVGSPAHRALARQAVRESLVLLKNSKGILPLAPNQHFLVAGNIADNIPHQMGGWSMTWQGNGTSNGSFPGATSIFDGLKETIHKKGGSVELSVSGEFSKRPDVAIVVFGESPYAEGAGDINTLEFEAGNKQSLALLKKLHKQNIPVVSVFVSGRPMWVNPELNMSEAFVAAWLPGSEGQGIADVIIANSDGSPNFDFSGTLSFSWPALPLQSRLNAHHKNYAPLFELGYGLNYSNKVARSINYPEKVKGLASAASGDINFYAGRPLQPWNVFISNPERNQILSGAFASLPSGDVKIETVDKDIQGDALKFSWSDTWRAEATLRGGKPLDLSKHIANGVLSLDINITELKKNKGGFDLVMKCGTDCERIVPMNRWGWEAVGQGWQQLRVPISCFVREYDSYINKVSQPFTLRAGGVGEISFANVRFLRSAKPNYSCADYKTVSTTPDILPEYWAIDWWMPRHKEKVARVKQGADLIFIGDSITEGWETLGADIWQKYYAPRNAVALGFGGDRTENVLWRLDHGEIDGVSPKVAVLMIGTNNTGHRMEPPVFIAKGVGEIITRLRAKLPHTKILLLAIFPRAQTPGDLARKNNDATNKIIREFADNKHVYYLDINSDFLTENGELPESIMPDLLHPNAAGYAIWAERMEPMLKKLMAE